MLITQRTLPHVCQFDGALATGIHEPIAALGMELCCCDDLSQLLHIRRLDVDDVEALILNVEIPKIDPKVITGDECFAVRIYGYAVDMIGMRIGVCSSWDSGHYSIMVGKAR